MANSSFFKDGGAGSGTFASIDSKLTDAEASKVAAEAAQAAAEQASTNAAASEAQAASDASDANLFRTSASLASLNAGFSEQDAKKFALNPVDQSFTTDLGNSGPFFSSLHYSEKAADSLASATTQASNAADSLASATTQASNAAASAVTAEQHKDNAESAKTSAESARDSALASFDSFDDRYLGAKTSDPSVDNDGNSLVAGSLYFNETSGDMKVFNGTSWVDAYADGATLVAKAGDTMTGNLSFGDNNKAIFGAGSDLQIYHDGSNSIVKDNGTGSLVLQGSSWTIVKGATSGSWGFAHLDGAQTNLYHNGSLKLGTTTTGVDVNGTVTADGLTVGLASNAGNTLFYGGTQSDRGLEIGVSNADGFDNSAWKINAVAPNSGSTLTLATRDTDRLKLDSNGDISFYEDTGTTPKLTWDASEADLKFADNSKAVFGAGSDLEIYHDGFRSVIKDAGEFRFMSNTLRLTNTGNNAYFTAFNGGAATIFHNGAAKIATTTTGIDVTGDITLSGTVDGRDVAADGTKLDGIEAGATADQTAAQILTAIKTVDGGGSGLDADTLDGIQASSFLRSDASDTVTGALTFSNAAVPINFIESDQSDGTAGKYWRYVLDGGNMRWDICDNGNGTFTPYTTPLQMYANGNITSQNNTIWHGGNDGSGSGLDADTVDGLQASSFLRSDAADTMTGELTISGTSPQMKFNDTDADDFWIHVNSNNFYILTDRDDNGSWDGSHPLQLTNATSTIQSYGNTVWTSGNDGSGSGLDADTVDGIQASSFLRSDADDRMTGVLTVDNHLIVENPSGVTGQGDKNTHWNYQNNGTNYIRGTLTYVSSPIDIAGNNIECDTNKGFNNRGAWTRMTTPHGNIEIGPANTSYGHIYTDRSDFYFNRGIYSTGNITAYASDKRLKENIKTIEGGLDKVCQLRGVTFDWKDDCEEKGFTPDMKTETGFIAQEVKDVLPEGAIPAPFDVDGSKGDGVSVSGEDYLTVNSQKIIPLLVEAIKELKQQIEDLKKG